MGDIWLRISGNMTMNFRQHDSGFGRHDFGQDDIWPTWPLTSLKGGHKLQSRQKKILTSKRYENGLHHLLLRIMFSYLLRYEFITLEKKVCDIKTTFWMNRIPAHNNTVGTLHLQVKNKATYIISTKLQPILHYHV